MFHKARRKTNRVFAGWTAVSMGLPRSVTAAAALWLAMTGTACPAPPDGSANPWDPDGDSISTAVEINPANAHLGFDTARVDPNPSRALGIPTAGTLDGGINLPDLGDSLTAYLHTLGTDVVDTDDWGTLALINGIEGAGRHFHGQDCLDAESPTRQPAQVLDMSLRTGGFFPPHVSHQNGRDVDLRYLRTDDTGRLDLREADSVLYDQLATAQLIQCLISTGRIERILYDSVRTGIFGPASIMVHDASGAHSNHFHVRITDPDGANDER